MRINFYLFFFFIYRGPFVLILVVFVLFLLHYVSAKFHLWPSSGDLPRPRIGMLSLVTVSPVITAFQNCCLSHNVFDQVNLWPAWVGIETAIFWQCSPGTVETQRLYPLRHGSRINSQIKKPHLKMIPIKDNPKMCLEITYLICMYKKDLSLNNLQWLICHKTKANNSQTDQ